MKTVLSTRISELLSRKNTNPLKEEGFQSPPDAKKWVNPATVKWGIGLLLAGYGGHIVAERNRAQADYERHLNTLPPYAIDIISPSLGDNPPIFRVTSEGKLRPASVSSLSRDVFEDLTLNGVLDQTSIKQFKELKEDSDSQINNRKLEHTSDERGFYSLRCTLVDRPNHPSSRVASYAINNKPLGLGNSYLPGAINEFGDISGMHIQKNGNRNEWVPFISNKDGHSTNYFSAFNEASEKAFGAPLEKKLGAVNFSVMKGSRWAAGTIRNKSSYVGFMLDRVKNEVILIPNACENPSITSIKDFNDKVIVGTQMSYNGGGTQEGASTAYVWIVPRSTDTTPNWGKASPYKISDIFALARKVEDKFEYPVDTVYGVSDNCEIYVKTQKGIRSIASVPILDPAGPEQLVRITLFQSPRQNSYPFELQSNKINQ